MRQCVKTHPTVPYGATLCIDAALMVYHDESSENTSVPTSVSG